MDRPEPFQRQGAEPPLWSIALAAAVIVFTPMVLYSIAPDGPIREGDTVFSNGAHKVPLFQPDRYRPTGFDSTCLLDPKDPLIVTHSQAEGPEDDLSPRCKGRAPSNGRSARPKQNSLSSGTTSPSNSTCFKTWAMGSGDFSRRRKKILAAHGYALRSGAKCWRNFATLGPTT